MPCDVRDVASQKADIGGHDTAGHRGHAAGHDRHQFGLGHTGDKGFDDQRGFGLPDKDVGRSGQGLRSAGFQRPDHDPGHDVDHHLHDAQVVEHGHQRREKDDRR